MMPACSVAAGAAMAGSDTAGFSRAGTIRARTAQTSATGTRPVASSSVSECTSSSSSSPTSPVPSATASLLPPPRPSSVTDVQAPSSAPQNSMLTCGMHKVTGRIFPSGGALVLGIEDGILGGTSHTPQ